MSIVRALPLLFALALGCSSEDDSPSRSDCERVANRLVDLQLEKRITSEAAREAELRKHRENLRASLGEGFLDGCEQQGNQAYVECVLGASSSAEAADCRRKK